MSYASLPLGHYYIKVPGFVKLSYYNSEFLSTVTDAFYISCIS